MKSVSILGCGWLGKSLASALIDDGYRVTGSTTQETKCAALASLGIHPVLARFTSSEDQTDASLFDADLLVISIPPGRKSEHANDYPVVLRKIRDHLVASRCRAVIFISSTSVYATSAMDVALTEGDAQPDSPMIEAENIFRHFPDTHTTIVRFGGLVGPDRHPGRFLAGKKNIEGGNAAVNLIHVVDCVRILSTIIRKGIGSEIFNAVADEHPSRLDFYLRASAALHMEAPAFDLDAVTGSKIVSNSYLKKQLSYTFTYPDPMLFPELTEPGRVLPT